MTTDTFEQYSDASAQALAEGGQDGVVRTNDGVPLKQSLAKALRRQKMRAFLLILPLLLFIFLTFLLPIGDMLVRSVKNDIVPQTIPRTALALKDWDPAKSDLPDEAVYTALRDDLLIAVKAKNHTKLGSRLNYEKSGMSSLFRKMGRKVRRLEDGPLKAQFIDADRRWGDPSYWKAIKQYSGRFTDGYFLNALDAQRLADGDVELKPENDRIYLYLFGKTFLLSLVITGLCILLGYPIAYLLSNTTVRTSNMLLILVLLPFWTSLLVRTSAWKVLLQDYGIINNTFVALGLVAEDGRLALINNQTGTIIAMTHILLPFMILPLYSVMKTIPPSYMRAAKSLGANDLIAFFKVYFPQTIPGIGAGAILTFILAIGYYITPELVGGTSGIFISNRIAYHISSSLNWGLAAALGTILLALVLVIYWLYDRMVGIDNIKLG